MAPQWARISDLIGRKSTLLIGSIGAIVCALLFGFSNNLWMAVSARLLAGLANPNLGVVQTFVGELRKDSLWYRFSEALVIGGYLAEPVSKYPSIFPPHSIWSTYPYLLPNLIVVLFLFTSCTLALFTLHEVHPKFKHRDVGLQLFTIILNFLNFRSWNSNDERGNYASLAPTSLSTPQSHPNHEPESQQLTPLTPHLRNAPTPHLQPSPTKTQNLHPPNHPPNPSLLPLRLH
ncbi:hypothetical protein B7494_g7861 [Chlorociboria aeruginascens]|nr:hypothetical protein B7494_g7861 [Chlorociboria aeruginascens]